MGTSATLKAEPRSGKGKGASRKLRAAGRVPAVIYGYGEETRSLSVDAHELSRLLASVHVENTILDIEITGERAPLKALVREIQRHAYREDVVHLDLYQIHAGERITLEVPVRLVGAAPGVKAGGIIQHALTELEIRCSADQIPEVIEVDISALEVGDSVHVSELVLPEGIESLVPGERSVCSVLPPTVVKAEEEEAVEPETEEAEPEVISRRKEEPEEE